MVLAQIINTSRNDNDKAQANVLTALEFIEQKK